MSIEEARGNPLRIHEPLSYRVTLQEPFVPITLDEAFTLAAHFPLVWRRDVTGRLELVAIRGFTKAGTDLPGIRKLGHDALPLLLQAYPMRYENHRIAMAEIGLDRVAPLATSDLGSPVFTQAGDFTPGAQLKVAALRKFGEIAEETQGFTDVVADAGALQVVALPGELRARVEVPELLFMGPGADTRELLDYLFAAFGGKRVAAFLAGHRLSLYRMGPLISMAR